MKPLVSSLFVNHRPSRHDNLLLNIIMSALFDKEINSSCESKLFILVDFFAYYVLYKDERVPVYSETIFCIDLAKLVSPDSLIAPPFLNR